MTKGHPAQPAPVSWPQVSMGIRRGQPVLSLTHQEVLLAVHFLAHVVERLPTKPSPCKDEGRERVPGPLETRVGPCCHFSNRPEADYRQISFPFNVMLLSLYELI